MKRVHECLSSAASFKANSNEHTGELGSILDVKMVCRSCGKVSKLGDCEPCIAEDGSEGTGFGCPVEDCGGIVEPANKGFSQPSSSSGPPRGPARALARGGLIMLDMRTTRKQLREMVEFLRKQGVDITISWAYGRPRCYRSNEATELSPRLPMGEMKLWLEGFESGMRAPRAENGHGR